MKMLKMVPSGAAFGLVVLASPTAFSATETSKVDRSPAVHAGGFSLQDEPAYCADIAQNFCSRIPGIKGSSDRVREYAPILQSAIVDAENTDGHQNLFAYLKRDLIARGYPVGASVKPAEIEAYLSSTYSVGSESIAKIFDINVSLCADASLSKAQTTIPLLAEIARISGVGLPSDESFDILRASSVDEASEYRGLRERVRNSVEVKQLRVALGDYDAQDASRREGLGKAYSAFLDKYTKELSELVINSRKEVLGLKSQFQEFTVLCHLLRKSNKISTIVEDECDVSSNLDVLQVDGFEFGVLRSATDLDQHLVEMRRKVWTEYQRFLHGDVPEGSLVMIKSFSSWRLKKISSEEGLMKAVLLQASNPQVMADIEEQLAPSTFDGDGVAIRNKFLCRRRAELYQQGLHREYQYVERMVRRSEGSVSAVQSKLFPKTDMDNLREIFRNVSKRSLIQFRKVSSAFSDPSMANRFEQAFKNLSPYDPGLVKDVYVEDPYTGLKVIDYTKIPNHDSFYNLFLDNNFGDLAVLNAYLESGHYAQLGAHNGVFVSPASYHSYQKNPASLFFLLSHEIAHSMGPDVFVGMGAKFPDDFKKVLACMAAKNSAGAKPHQHSECFADWFATEVLASTLADVPAEQRFAFAQDSLVALCELSDEGAMPGATQGDGKARGKYETDVHLSPRRRINAIIAAHPAVREALGCRLEGPYPYCGFSGGVR